MSSWKFMLIVSVFLLSGCTRIQKLQELQVSLIKISPAPSAGLLARFDVQLSVLNPNATDLQIDGISMQLDIADQKILSGVSRQIPTLSAYSETAVELQTSVNLFSLYQLLTKISEQGDREINYRLNTRIDPTGFIAFDLNKQGVLNESLFQGLTKRGK